MTRKTGSIVLVWSTVVFFAAIAPALAQQSLSSPVTVGGVNCGEIRLKEAFATGTGYATMKTCRNGFGRLENTFIDGSGTTYLSMDAAGLKQIGQVSVRNTIGGGDVVSMFPTGAGSSGALNIWTNNSNSATIRLEGQYAGAGTEAGVSMFADGGGETFRLLGGTTSGTAARMTIFDSSGNIGLFASGGGQLSAYNSGAERMRLSPSGGLALYDGAGTVTYRANGNWIDLQQLTAPSAPASGYVRAYAKTATAQWCFKDSTGAEVCGAGSGSFVDTTTNQNIAGIKFTSGAWRAPEIAVRASSGAANVWQSYIASGAGITEVWPSGSASFATAQLTGNYSAGGTAALLMLDPASGAERVRIQGGSASVNPLVAVDRSVGAQARLGADGTRGGYLELYSTTPTVRVKLNTSTSNGVQVLDASGNSRIVLDGSGAGGAISSAGSSFSLTQTGDSLGSSSLTLYNRTGSNGVVITSSTNDLAEFQLQGSAGTNRTVRMEGRSGAWWCGYGTAEVQMGFTDSFGTADFGLVATRSGSCIPKSYPMRWMGSSSGYVALKAPAAISSYTLDLPTSTGTAGQCLYLVTTTTLGWTSCGGGGSFVDTTTNQNISGNKFTSNAWRGTEIAVRASSGAANIFQAYVGGSGQGIEEVWASSSSSFATSQRTGNYLSSGFAALTFNSSSTGAELIKIGGTSGNAIVLYGSGGSGTGVSMAGNAVGGTFSVYDSTSQEVVRISGSSNRVWNGLSLATGYTGSISTGTCTIDVVRGWITGKTGTC